MCWFAPSIAWGATAFVREAARLDASGHVTRGLTIYYVAAPGEANRLKAAFDRGEAFFSEATLSITLGERCNRATTSPGLPDLQDAECFQDLHTTTYGLISLGDADDVLLLHGGKPPTSVVSINAGVGDDYFRADQQPTLQTLRIFGALGDDAIYAGRWADLLSGGPGNDRLFGQTGNDAIFGGTGNDLLSGSLGDDRLFGSFGNDRIYAGPGRNYVDGGTGNDTIFARNFTRDVIRCGTGVNHVSADRIDLLIGC